MVGLGGEIAIISSLNHFTLLNLSDELQFVDDLRKQHVQLQLVRQTSIPCERQTKVRRTSDQTAGEVRCGLRLRTSSSAGI